MRKRTALVLILLGALGTGWWWTALSHEPIVRGQPLSKWLPNLPLARGPDVDFFRTNSFEAARTLDLEGQRLFNLDRQRYLENQQALAALDAIGSNAVPWLLCQWHTPQTIRARIYYYLSNKHAPNFLLNALQKYQWPDLRPDPIPALCLLRTKAHSAIPLMLSKLADPNETIRIEARQVIEAAFVEEEDAPKLLAMFSNPIVRIYAFPILAVKAPQRIPRSEMLASFEHSNHAAKQAALAAVTHLGTNGVEYLPQVIASLKTKNEQSRYAAIKALGSIGAPAADALCEIFPMDPFPDEISMLILKQLIRPQGDSAKTRTLLKKCYSRDPNRTSDLVETLLIRNSASEILEGANLWRELNTACPSVIYKLGESLKSIDPNLRAKACLALGEVQGDPLAVIPKLVQCLDDPESMVRCKAVMALGRYGTNAASALPALNAIKPAKNTIEHEYLQNAKRAIDSGNTAAVH